MVVKCVLAYLNEGLSEVRSIFRSVCVFVLPPLSYYAGHSVHLVHSSHYQSVSPSVTFSFYGICRILTFL